MTQKELLYAVTVYEEGSFSAAAKKLFVSQPALSQSIRKLEDEFGFALFTRFGSKSVPTKAGQTFAEHGRRVLQVWDQFEMQMHVYAQSCQTDLTIGMSPFIAKNLSPHILSRFEALHPDVKVDIMEDRSDTVEQLVMQDVINLCLVSEPVCNSALERIPVFTLEMLLAVPMNHPFCRKHPYRGLTQLETVDLRELKDERFSILKNPRKNHLFDNVFAEMGFSPKIYRCSTVLNNVKDYIKRGASIGLLNELLVCHEPDDDKIAYYRINSSAVFFEKVIAFRPGKRLTPQEQWFIDVLKEYRPIAKCQQPSSPA